MLSNKVFISFQSSRAQNGWYGVCVCVSEFLDIVVAEVLLQIYNKNVNEVIRPYRPTI